MKLLTFQDPRGNLRAGFLKEESIYDLQTISNNKLPNTILELIQSYPKYQDTLPTYFANAKPSYHLDQVKVKAPIPNPPSIRDFMAFEEHIVNATKKSGLTLAKEWYEIPAFYFTNHLALVGNEEIVERPPNCKALDFELEIACIIGKRGKNIKAENAEQHIFGYTIFNDWSARDLQMKEMKVGLGPAKGKDFATSIGPVIVTKDELELYKTEKGHNLAMTAKVNGVELSRGNFKDIHYSFEQMIERASDGVELHPGEIIGSGTVGTGCILELGTDVQPWLEPGDIVELHIEGIGTLKNQIK
ncbi:fumarylacetoacetate hydrolase family protein [Geomicrobium sediminis]|uniref:2-keto-4-pentenoate hydratase/2-oxohepta-3-ene-1,7-dioic acid hydratase in catechol pathway n=1 Tax=Geomicrobium sediminis TaxID=1347788 RepID=A0ABS2P7S1_9BACL|nr:fumarylacetoacetate hydrolase family protein [Geomicrobium sediminis]MBM7631056.1 2-keto-4-pentenoate hydratase/2-oxohepta-3-ene-1,7-dioic acid hydratase in catechol pathway [Geomicrobium sediminis]